MRGRDRKHVHVLNSVALVYQESRPKDDIIDHPLLSELHLHQQNLFYSTGLSEHFSLDYSNFNFIWSYSTDMNCSHKNYWVWIITASLAWNFNKIAPQSSVVSGLRGILLRCLKTIETLDHLLLYFNIPCITM